MKKLEKTLGIILASFLVLLIGFSVIYSIVRGDFLKLGMYNRYYSDWSE